MFSSLVDRLATLLIKSCRVRDGGVEISRIPHCAGVFVFHGMCSPLVDRLTAADKRHISKKKTLEGQTGDCSVVGHTSDFFFDCCFFSALFNVEQSSSKWWRYLQAVRKMLADVSCFDLTWLMRR